MNYRTKAELNTVEGFKEFSIISHHAASDWWKDVKTGEPLNRNVGELLCLAHSELTEAWEGIEGIEDNLMDDHLPHREMFVVELADTCVRIGDMFEGLKCTIDSDSYSVGNRPNYRVAEWLLTANKKISQAMEIDRKGRDGFGQKLYEAFVVILFIFDNYYSNLDQLTMMDVIEEKMKYNAQRADHKIENRAKDNGKTY